MTPINESAAQSGYMRTFFGIACDQPVNTVLQQFMGNLQQDHEFRHVKWQNPAKLHITLKFLGSTRSAQIPQFAAKVRTEIAQLPAFKVTFTELQLFPSTHQPRLITLAPIPTAPLRELHQRLESIVAKHGFPPEDRLFRPHMTLGRVLGHTPKIAAKWQAQPIATLPVETIILYQSAEPDPHRQQPAPYRILEKFPLSLTLKD